MRLQTTEIDQKAPAKTCFRKLTQSHVAIIIFLVAATFAVFWPVNSCLFINYDDPEYITRNDWVQQGLTREGIVWAFSHVWAYNWHPVTWLSHMLDVSLFGSGASGPHLVNLLLHSSNVALLFLFLLRMTSARWPSAFTAALFALHPLHVESVAWVSERKDVLSLFFGLLCLRAYVIYTQALHRPKSEVQQPTHIPANRTASRPRSHYALALLLYGLSLMSKPMLVTLPLVMLLLDYWPLNRAMALKWQSQELRRLLVEKLPFVGLSVVSCVITVAAQATAGAVNTLAQMPLTARIANALVSYVRYQAKLIWPEQLVLPYAHPGHWPLIESSSAALLMCFLSWAAWHVRKRAPFALVGCLWFLITLLPVIGLVQVGIQAMADRYMYLPSIGLFVIVAWAGQLLAVRWLVSTPVIAVCASLILLAFAFRTRDQLHYWRNSEVLFTHTLAVTRNNYAALINHAGALEEQGRLEEALQDYQEASRIYPEEPSVPYKMGTVFLRKNDDAIAIHYFEQALRANPTFSDAHNSLGVIFKKQGNLDRAMAEYREALRLEPGNAEAQNNLANLLVGQGQIDEAVRHYRLAVKNAPRYTLALDNLGWALAQQGHHAEAVAYCERALKIKPDDAELRESFGDLLLRLGRNQEAMEQYSKAVELAPGSAEAHLGLGRALARLGQRDLARTHLQEALRLQPDNPEASKELDALAGSAGPSGVP
jgi:Tfp pilus assembly protein PilF